LAEKELVPFCVIQNRLVLVIPHEMNRQQLQHTESPQAALLSCDTLALTISHLHHYKPVVSVKRRASYNKLQHCINWIK